MQAASTMLQSDIRRLAFFQRPELTGICFVKNWAFFGREYRGLPLLTKCGTPIVLIVPAPKPCLSFVFMFHFVLFIKQLVQKQFGPAERFGDRGGEFSAGGPRAVFEQFLDYDHAAFDTSRT